MKVIHFFKIYIILFCFIINTFAVSEKNDTLIINVTRIIKDKIENAKWLKNSVARADLFNIPVMVAIYEEDKVDVYKTDGEDPAIFSKVIAENLIRDAINNRYSKFETFAVDTLFYSNFEKQRTDLYILRNYISSVTNKRKPVYIVSSEILKKESFSEIGKEFQDSLLNTMRSVTLVKAEVPGKKTKKKSWFKRKKKIKKVEKENIDSTLIKGDSLGIKDTVREVFVGTDSLENYHEASGKNRALIIFLLVIIASLTGYVLFIFKEKSR